MNGQRPMNPNVVRYFLEVVRAGSFLRAGENLRIAASAVNRQISNLEKQLSAPLFERSRGRNRLRLTAAGEVFMLHARTMTSELERAAQEIEALKGLRTGSIALGIPETLTRDFLPPVLADFNKLYPRISFNVSVAPSPRLLDMLLQDEIEIALAYNLQVPPAVEVVEYVDKRTCIMIPRSHPLAQRRSVRLSDCADYPIVMPGHGTSMRDLYDRIFAKLRITPKAILTTTSFEMLRSAAAVGLGIAILNDYLTPQRRASLTEPVFIPIRDPAIKPQRLVCCMRRGRHNSAAVLAFIEKLKSVLAALKRRPLRAPSN
jgi:DNA-binding transcriptional LysR family regulator